MALRVNLVAMLTLVAAGCGAGVPVERYTGNAQSGTVSREGEFDLQVLGNGHSIIVTSGTVRRLDATGNGHQITIRPGVRVEKISLTGTAITVRVPADVHPEVTKTGVGCEVVTEKGGE